MYLDQDGNEVACPDNRTGLYIQPRQRSGESPIDPVRVQLPSHASSSCILYQIGETSQIQSGGLLQATPHAVIVATDDNNRSKYITRESFAVFMEPEFDTPLLQPPTSSNSSINVDNTSSLSLSSLPFLPSLQQRWKPGQTFGDFHLATVSSFTTS
jgi:isopenicillin N synthase-like dioxygenase